MLNSTKENGRKFYKTTERETSWTPTFHLRGSTLGIWGAHTIVALQELSFSTESLRTVNLRSSKNRGVSLDIPDIWIYHER
jgi:hypothetical protein